MMRKFLAIVIMCVLLFSCKEDEYDPVSSAWATVELSDADVFNYHFILDDNTVLSPVESNVNYTPDTNDRAYLHFNIKPEFEAGDAYVEAKLLDMDIYSIQDLVVITDSVGWDTLGIDPVAVYDNEIWQSHYLLNVPCYLGVSYYQLKRHDVELVYFPDSVDSERGAVHLELRHNANADSEDKVLPFFYTFDMTSIEPFRNIEDSVLFTIDFNVGDFNFSPMERYEGVFYNTRYLY